MKLYKMVYFAEVYKHKSVSKAAEILYVSQPAISAAIKSLEDDFGIKLFVRANNKIEPTKEGELFYEKATRIIAEMNLLEKEMSEIGKKYTVIKVCTPPMIGMMLFPKILSSLRGAYPNINIEILEYGSVQARKLVSDNEADVAIAIMDNVISDGLDTRLLFKTELVFCVNKNHEFAGRETVSWLDIEEQNIILMKEDSYQNAVLKKHFADNRIQPNIMLYSSQLTTLKNFVINGGCGAFLFKDIAKLDRDLVAIPLSEPIYLDIGIMWRDEIINKDMERFIGFVQKYVAENSIGKA